MIRKILYLTLLFTLSIPCVNSQALKKYSSIKYKLTISSKSMPQKVSSTYYKKGDSLRIEMDIQGQQSITIAKKGRPAYIYYPSENMAIPVSLPENVFYEEADYSRGPGVRLIGEETIRGIACDVYEKDSSGHKTKIWIDKNIEFPVKIQVLDPEGANIDYSDVAINIPLDDSLFTLPAGVKIIDTSKTGEAMRNLGSTYDRR